MKKVLILISLFLLVGCSWNYQEKSLKVETEEVVNKTLEELELENQKAQEVIEQIKDDEDKIMSKVLDSFLKSEEINIKQELLNTQNRYNDLLGPILEYEHEKVETQSGSTSTGSTATGVTLSGTTISDQELSDLDELLNSSTGSIYSGEVKIVDTSVLDSVNEIDSVDNVEEEIEVPVAQITVVLPEYKIDTKVGNSGTYKSYVGVRDICKGGLKMIKKDGTEKWLFLNSCDKMISNFTLDIGGIKVQYLDIEGNTKNEFVSIN